MAVGLSTRGPKGDPGNPGAQGPAGQDAVASSDAVRGQLDRFYRVVGGVLSPDGLDWVAKSDSFSRGQNVDHVTTGSTKITVAHEEIGARALVDVSATVGENLRSVGISAIARTAADLKSTDILLRQTRTLDDSASNPGDGTAWVREKDAASPFTLSDLDGLSTNFPAVMAAITGLQGYYRHSEASGATIADTSGNSRTGAVVSTGTTYAVVGPLAHEADKAMTVAAGGTNEFTYPLSAAIGPTNYSVVWYGKIPTGGTVLWRDGSKSTTTGHHVAKSGTKIYHRYGTNVLSYTTTKEWADIEDGGYHLVVATKSGSTVALYIDGELIDSRTGVTDVAINGAWHIGRSGQAGGVEASQAVTISEFAGYSTALTAADVHALWYAATSTGYLHVEHDDMGSALKSGIKLTGQGLLRPVLVPGSVTNTSFDVAFYDDTGTQVVLADTDMAVGISREVRNQPVDPTDLSVQVIVEKEEDWVDAVDTTAPILHARLGESSGSTLVDRIGSNDGTLQSGVTLGAASGVVGDADTGVTFNGVQGKIGFANPGFTGAFSIGVIFNCTGVGSVGDPTYGTVIGWGTSKRILVKPSDGAMLVQVGGANLTAPVGTATTNTQRLLVFTWDGTTQRLYVAGALVAEGVTASVTLNAAFYLGSYLTTSTNYSFKGDQDELILWDRAISSNEVQQLHVTARDTVLRVDRAAQAQIGFRAEFETIAPPPEEEPEQPIPVATALPAGDVGGAVSSYISLKSYRDAGYLDFGPTSPWGHRALPATQLARDAIELNGLSGFPNATSDNWRLHVCSMFGIDSTTGAAITGTQGNPSVYLRVGGERIYVIENSGHPRRFLDDVDITFGGWAAAFEAAEATVGNLPIPADALPHATGDRYTFVYQPPYQWATIYSHQPSASQRATTTLEFTSSPSSGGFFLEFDYMDSVNSAMQTFFLQTPAAYNVTDVALKALINAAKTTAGTTFAASGARAQITAVTVTGGPLNVAPIEIQWGLGAPLQPVAMRMTNSFLNAGSVGFTYENAQAWGECRFGSITDPALSADHEPHASGVPATAAATHIDWFPLIVDWDEYKTAYDIGIADGWDAAGTDLGHVLPMTIGNCGAGWVWPATEGDGTFSNADKSKIVEGALMTFPLDADSSRVAPEFMPIFNTIQRYGVILIDKSGGGAEIIFRNWTWPGLSRPFPGPSSFVLLPNAYTAYMKSLPWHQLQIIDPDAVQAGW